MLFLLFVASLPGNARHARLGLFSQAYFPFVGAKICTKKARSNEERALSFTAKFKYKCRR